MLTPKTDKTPARSLTRARTKSAQAFRTWRNHNPQLCEKVLRSGLRVEFFGQGKGQDEELDVKFRLKEPRWTEQQKQIANLLCSEHSHNLPSLWTIADIAFALRLDPKNRRVLGNIGKDLIVVRAHSRQVARLVGSERLRVYSFDPLDGFSPKALRSIYRTESSNRQMTRTSGKSKKVPVRAS